MKYSEQVEVMTGVFTKGVSIGSRVDTGRPAWVTPEITKSGFSSGNHLAGGPLKQHELDVIKDIDGKTSTEPSIRYAINNWCLTNKKGREWITDLANSGQYCLNTMEESAIMSIVLLGKLRDTSKLVAEIEPWFRYLRFFPEPKSVNVSELHVPRSSVLSVENLHKKLVSEKNPMIRSIELMKHAMDKLEKFNESYMAIYNKSKEILPLFSGYKTRRSNKMESFKTFVGQIRKVMNDFGLESRIAKSTAGKLLNAIDVFIKYGMDTKKSFRKHIELHLGNASSKIQLRSRTPEDMAKNIRSSVYEREELMKIIHPMRDSIGIEKETVDALVLKFPDLKKSIKRTTLGTLTELCQEGLIESAEMFADQVAVMSAIAKATVFKKGAHQNLARNMYKAFSSRRSKLLLNLETQVKMSEIPWFTVFEKVFRTKTKDTDEISKSVFIEYLSNFPGIQMPNSFVDVMSHQLGRNGLVKEIAADIFMGKFVKTFGAQAKERETVLGEDTPYGAYYSESIIGFPKGSEKKTVKVEDLIYPVKNEVKKEPECKCEDMGILTQTKQMYIRIFGKCCCQMNSYSVGENRKTLDGVYASTTHNLLWMLVDMNIDQDMILLEKFAIMSWKVVMDSLKSGRLSIYRYVTGALRSFLVFVSLIVRMIELPDSIMTMLENSKEEWVTENESFKPVLEDVIAAIKTNTKASKPLVNTGRY